MLLLNHFSSMKHKCGIGWPAAEQDALEWFFVTCSTKSYQNSRICTQCFGIIPITSHWATRYNIHRYTAVGIEGKYLCNVNFWAYSFRLRSNYSFLHIPLYTVKPCNLDQDCHSELETCWITIIYLFPANGLNRRQRYLAVNDNCSSASQVLSHDGEQGTTAQCLRHSGYAADILSTSLLAGFPEKQKNMMGKMRTKRPQILKALLIKVQEKSNRRESANRAKNRRG